LIRKGENKTQWAFVKAGNVHSPRGQQVIHKIDGYLPKQRTNAYFWVKKEKSVGLSGNPDYRILSTEAWSDTEQGAKAWIAQQENPEQYKIVFDRELTNEQRMYDVAATHGGMYSGARKSTELPFVGDGDGEFASAFEGLQHYINHIGRQYPATLYRIGSEARLIKMANEMGVKARNLNLHNVLDIVASKGIDKTSDKYKALKGIHDQISFVNMIPTHEEAEMASRWVSIGKMFEGPILSKVPGMKNAPKFFYQKAAKNAQPVDIIRGITFNHLLGMYNPAQLLVQYSGALVSFAIDPVNIGKHVSKQWGWTMLDNIASDPMAQKKLITWMQEKGLGDFAEEYELWAKSGFKETIEQGNADYTSVFTRNLPYDEGILRDALANHTLFYKMGELANTRVAFATSISRYKKVHNVTRIDPNDSAALEELGLWAEKYRLNMSRANQSDLNRGLKAVPLQFQQIISKYFEKVLPQVVGGTDEFTGWEKARLMIIPTVMTGAVGVPYGEYAVEKILSFAGMKQEDLTEVEAQSIKHGVIGVLSNQLLDINLNFSDRMTLGGNVVENVWDSLTHGKMTWQWLGASGNVADRYVRNMQYLSEAFDLTVAKNEDVTMQDIAAMPAILLEAATDIPSVTRNFKKYASHIFSDNPQFIVEGKYKWDFETMNSRTAFIASLGFQPSEATDMYEMNKELLDSPTEFSTWGDTDADVILRIVNTRLLNGGSVRETALYSKMINSMIKKYGPNEQRKLLEQMWQKTTTKQFDQNNLLYKTLMKEVNDQQEGVYLINALYARKQQERK